MTWNKAEPINVLFVVNLKKIQCDAVGPRWRFTKPVLWTMKLKPKQELHLILCVGIDASIIAEFSQPKPAEELG